MPISEPYNPANDPAINPFRKRSSANTEIIKRFVTPQTSVSGGGNGVTTLDDPTFLGFSLRFDITSPLFNGATNGTPPPPPVADSLVNRLGGALGLNAPAPEPGMSSSGIPTGESAIGYLKQVGEVQRAEYLQSFIQGLIEINTYRPYYWQTVDGLQEAWTNSSNMLDPYNGSKDGEGIVIGCLEAIDLKISAIFSLYRAAALDNGYNRFVLPRNLMYFDVYIDVYEIRNFKSSVSWLDKINSAKNGFGLAQTDVDRFLNDNTSRMTFKFSDCTWDVNETGKIFEKVTNAGGNEMAATSMKWGYKRIEMQSTFSGYDKSLSDGESNRTKGTLKDFVKEAGKEALQNAANSALERARQAAAARVQGLLLGNVFGLRNRVFNALSNPGALAAAAAGAAIQAANLFGPKRPTGPALGDNPLGNPPAVPNSLPTDSLFAGQGEVEGGPLESSNLFGPSPSGPPPLKPTNVFG